MPGYRRRPAACRSDLLRSPRDAPSECADFFQRHRGLIRAPRVGRVTTSRLRDPVRPRDQAHANRPDQAWIDPAFPSQATLTRALLTGLKEIRFSCLNFD